MLRTTLKQVISGKYGEEEGGWCSTGVRTRWYGVRVWKAIKSGWDGFKRKMTFKVGNGKRVKFWTDRWCGDKPLGDAFLMLFSIASTKDA